MESVWGVGGGEGEIIKTRFPTTRPFSSFRGYQSFPASLVQQLVRGSERWAGQGNNEEPLIIIYFTRAIMLASLKDVRQTGSIGDSTCVQRMKVGSAAY